MHEQPSATSQAPRPPESVDLLSADLDPVFALENPNLVVIPDPTARPLDYLGKMKTLLQGDDYALGFTEKPVVPEEERIVKEKLRNAWKEKYDNRQRRAELMEQYGDVLERIMRTVKTQKTESSPFEMLYVAYETRRRVEIATLDPATNKQRGTITANIRGFDKHYNLVLTDVRETYTTYQFTPAAQQILQILEAKKFNQSELTRDLLDTQFDLTSIESCESDTEEGRVPEFGYLDGCLDKDHTVTKSPTNDYDRLILLNKTGLSRIPSLVQSETRNSTNKPIDLTCIRGSDITEEIVLPLTKRWKCVPVTKKRDVKCMILRGSGYATVRWAVAAT